MGRKEMTITMSAPHDIKNEVKRLLEDMKTEDTKYFSIQVNMNQQNAFKQEFGMDISSYISQALMPQKPIHKRRKLI